MPAIIPSSIQLFPVSPTLFPLTRLGIIRLSGADRVKYLQGQVSCDVQALQIGQQCSQVAGFFDHRPRGDPQPHAQLVGDDVAQGGLSQSGRTVEQGVVERLATVFGCFDKYAQVIDYALLAAKVVET